MLIYLSVQDGGGAACSGLGTARCAQQAAPAPAGGVTAPAQAPPAPAVGGTVPVFTYLDAIALGNLKLILREKELDGAFFLQCTREDLQAIGSGRLKWKKIKMYMPQ